MNRPNMEFIQTGQDPYYPPSTTPRTPQPNLRVQTSNYSTPQLPSPSPSDPPYPRYPIPIPYDKQDRALELYIDFQSAELAEGLEQRQSEQRPAHNYLSVPGSSAPQSTASRTSSKRYRDRALSVSTIGDGQTEFSSVMSFDGDESPSSAKARQSELKTFDGKVVKPRVRKRLSPKSKAKAALIRHLGSCWVCKKRAVSCPLEHYDFASLEKLHQAKLQMRQPTRGVQQSRGSKSIPRRHARSISMDQATVTTAPQTSDLSFIGQNPNLLHSSVPYGTQLDIQSPSGGLDLLSEISPHSAPFYQTATSEDPIGHTLYSQYQDGAMLAIGVLRDGYFNCRCLGFCNERFNNPESLQLHFERSHFAYTRIDPAYRVVCKGCQYIEGNMNGVRCEKCSRTGMFEMWIYGRYIRVGNYWRDGGDGGRRDMWHTPTSGSYAASYTASYDGLNLEGGNDESGGGFGGSLNGSPNPGTSYFQNFGLGNNGNGADYSYLPQNHPNHQNSPSQGNNNYTHTHTYTSQTKPHPPHSHHSPVLPKTKTLAILLCLLLLSSLSITLTLALSFSTSPLDDFQRLTRLLPSIASTSKTLQAHMPALAFMSLVGSFGVCSGVKHVGILRGGRSLFRPKYRRLRGLVRVEVCRQTVPESFLRGGGFS